MPITSTADTVTLREAGLVAEVPRDRVRFAHMGCMLLGKLRDPKQPLPEEVVGGFVRLHGPKWHKTDDATGQLGAALAAAARASGYAGVVLVDTMRNGSDAWRPGAFLTDAAEVACLATPGLRVGYAREDCLCPPADLLKEFTRGAAGMPFGEYAARYAEHLRRGPAEVAAALLVRNLAEGRMPVFYCVDPYIPGYGDPADFCSCTPYRERAYPAALRTWGCHRVVLAEEIARVFTGHQIPVDVLEVDQKAAAPHCRAVRPDGDCSRERVGQTTSTGGTDL